MSSNPADGDPHALSFWYRLALTPGLGARAARALVGSIGGQRDLQAIAAALARHRPELARLLLSPPAALLRQIDAAIDWSAAPGHHLISVDHPHYPETLAQLVDAPLVLHVDGRPELLAAPAVALVGSRNASADGIDLARSIAARLAEAGWVVASGLASGIDLAAHLGALDRAGLTAAVIGTGVDLCYPEGHAAVARRIAEHGALISELPLGAPPLPRHFPMRNRLIAGLARGVLVVQAARRSGSLITARFALDYGREVMAVPGSVHSPVHKGCHQLIREGALLVESADDVLEALLGPAQRLLPGFDPPQRVSRSHESSDAARYPSARAGDPGSVDVQVERLLESLGWSPIEVDALHRSDENESGELARQMLELELSGRIVRLADGRVQRVF